MKASKAILEVVDYRAKIPLDCRRIISIKVPALCEYKVFLHDGYILLSSDIKRKEIEIEYVPYDTQKIDLAVKYIKILFPNFTEYNYRKAVQEGDEGNFMNFERYFSYGIPRTNHEMFLFRVKNYFNRLNYYRHE